jgi:TonB family protein
MKPMNMKAAVTILLLWGAASSALEAADKDMCLCKFVAPRYSAVARTAAIQGIVRVKVDVDSDGIPTSVDAVEGHPLLKDIAVDAVKQWRFCSSWEATRNHPVTITLRFKLEGKGTDHWAATEIDFQSPATVDIITSPPGPLGPDVVPRK